ncbi:hypothetical protein N7478_009759 [Penicillium angulare]|uniref:uncharacterized protein n=1 Tax=Penicillium angulare TaxID=116970 RepID=UPI00253F763F|nr:uncharacterized protein N7478_009759 [Penicillium angulare]KAJ5266951.1 hypothetical protein N7478_009759 [Penicillium angulare]
MSQFQLFPPPQPEVKIPKNPFRKGVKAPVVKTKPGSSIPLEEIQDTSKTSESVLVQIIQDTQSFPPPPPPPVPAAAHLARAKSPAKSVSSHGSSSPRPVRSHSRQEGRSDHQALPSQSRMSNGSGSVRTVTSASSPQSSQSSVSPMPMRSMFPQFNSKVPLDQQSYRLQMPISPPDTTKKPSRKPNLTLSPSSEIDQVLGPKTVPASVLNFPTGVLESEGSRFSSPQELEMLWEAANGQRQQELYGTFNLRLTKTGPATFAFGNSRQPFYRLETYSNNEISISRGAPSTPENDVPIMTLTLEDRNRRDHPNDGLVALLFSRLAAMLAIDQADEISKTHYLSGSEAAEVERKALKRAAAQESCRLSWNRNLRLYELRHPSLSKQQPPSLVGAAGIPLSPVQAQSSGILYITVSTSSDRSPSQPPTIIVTGPMSSTAMEAARQAANPRTSTLPAPDSDEPLAVLDFGSRKLSISPAAVIATIPSLYAVDSLVAAILAVAVSDEATNPILADMELGTPKSVASSFKSAPRPGLFRGKLITTQAERDDYAESMELASQIESVNAKSDPEAKDKGFLKFWSRSKSSPTPQDGKKTSKSKNNKQVLVEEFDLEKYGRYGRTSSREGEKLPGIVRGTLKILFFGLNLIVKTLTALVKILAWMLVSMTRCVTSEKF